MGSGPRGSSKYSKRLRNSAISLGPSTAFWGRQTAAAVRAFQSHSGLEPDGIVGPATMAVLFPGNPTENGLDQPNLVWFKEARRLIGTRENPTVDSNPEILDWARAQGIPSR